MTPEPLLQKNLAAIHQVDAQLAQRLCLPVSANHLIEQDGDIHYVHHQTKYPFRLSDTEAEKSISEIDPSRPVLIFGIGLGEQLHLLLSRAPPVTNIVAWDTDPLLFRKVLETFDLTDAIESHRLKLILGIDLLNQLPLHEDFQIVDHPLLRHRYNFTRNIVSHGLRDQRCLMCSGGVLVGDVANGLLGAGYSIYILEADLLSPEELQHTLRTFNPTLIASVNFRDGLTEMGHHSNTPLLVWEVDPSTDRLRKPATPAHGAHIFTYREKNLDEFRSVGFTNVEYLPLAANPQRRHRTHPSAAELQPYRTRVSFVAASMVKQAELNRKRFFELYREHTPTKCLLPQDQLSQLVDRILTEQSQNQTKYRIPELLNQFLPELVARLEKTKAPLIASQLLAESAASTKRLHYLESIAEYSPQVWGDNGWQQLESCGVVYRGYARHGSELTHIYCASDINIDIGRLYQNEIITMRVFDILSCGGFLITEHNPNLEDLLTPGVELETYSTAEELNDKIGYYLAHPDKIRAIAEAGHNRVLSEHTIKKRIDLMLNQIGSHSATMV